MHTDEMVRNNNRIDKVEIYNIFLLNDQVGKRNV